MDHGATRSGWENSPSQNSIYAVPGAVQINEARTGRGIRVIEDLSAALDGGKKIINLRLIRSASAAK